MLRSQHPKIPCRDRFNDEPCDFINRISNDVVTRGLQTVLAELELDFADNLILSFDKSATNKMIETTWKQAEKEVN